MLRIGIISELGEEENLGFARVYFDENKLVSDWLPLPSTNTQSTKHWIPVEVNSQVACLMDEYCEQGVIVMVLWSTPDSPPGWAGKNTYGIQFSDATEFFYDTESKKLMVNAPDSELNFSCKTVNFDCETFNIDGKVNIMGDTGIEGQVDIDGDAAVSGGMDISKNTSVGGSVIANGDVTTLLTNVGLATHAHTTPMGVSGPPVPNT